MSKTTKTILYCNLIDGNIMFYLHTNLKLINLTNKSLQTLR